MIEYLRDIIVKAAPTCTLWVPDVYMNALRFRFYSKWKIPHTEYMRRILN